MTPRPLVPRRPRCATTCKPSAPPGRAQSRPCAGARGRRVPASRPRRHAAEQVQGRRARQSADQPPESGQLIAALDAAAVSLRPPRRRPGARRGATPAVDASAALQALGVHRARRWSRAPRSAVAVAARGRARVPAGVVGARSPRPGLLRALVALAREDTVAAGSLLAGLLPAQGAMLDSDISYDLTVRGFGTFAITVRDGVGAGAADRAAAATARGGVPSGGRAAGARRVARGRAAPDPAVRARARVNGRRKRVRVLAALPRAALSLADVVTAGARLEPIARLPRAAVRGRAGMDPRARVHGRAGDRRARRRGPGTSPPATASRWSVVEHVSGAAADATVTMTRAAFDRLLRGEPAAEGELPVVRGNREAVATLKRWTELAAGA